MKENKYYYNYKCYNQDVISTMCNFESSMTEALYQLYRRFWNDYLNINRSLRDENALPYLLAPSRNYENADIRIMICGKESLDWGHGEGEFNEQIANVEDLMRLYDYWINGNGGTITDNGNYGAFMNFYAEWFKYWFEEYVAEDTILKERIINTHKTIGCIAGNIIKISHRGTGFDSALNEPFYKIFGEEIEILNPDIIVATVYTQNDSSYRKILDNKFGIATSNYNFNGNKEYRKITIGNRVLYLMRHPQCISTKLKKRIWDDVREDILSRLP